MPRASTPQQLAAANAAATKPVYLLAWEHSGIEELIACTVGDVVYNGQTYAAGDVRISRIDDGRSARLSMPASAARVTESLNGTWRSGRCRIYNIPATPTDDLTFLEAEAILVLDGQIRTSGMSGDTVNVYCEHIDAGTRISPRHTFDAICNHLPPAGSVITWEGDTIVLEAPR